MQLPIGVTKISATQFRKAAADESGGWSVTTGQECFCYSRSVEVHAVGFTKEDNAVMRVWQVSGGSVSNEPVGWKLLRLDEATEAVVTKQKSLAPRPGYKPGDPVMQQMTCQL